MSGIAPNQVDRAAEPEEGSPASSPRGRTRRSRLATPILDPPQGLRDLRVRLLLLALWTLLGALEAGKEWVAANLSGTPREWDFVLLVNVPWWLAWALLTPVIFMLAAHFRLDGAHRARAIAIHAGTSVVVSLVHLSLLATLVYFALVRGGDFADPTLAGQVRFFVEGYLLFDVFTYWMVVGGYHALSVHDRLRSAEIEQAHLEARAARAEARAGEARLEALRMEINPHFLFNTLSAISVLVRRDEPDDARRALSRLSDLLRSTFRRRWSATVSLAEELAFVERYLSLETLRWGDRLEVDFDVAPDAAEMAVPPLVLQPIVENAVRHGVAATRGKRHVVVRARREAERLLLEVADTGPGFGRGEARWSVHGRDSDGSADGRGLANVAARLHELYGAEARLTCGDGPAGGALVRVGLPARPAGSSQPEPGAAPPSAAGAASPSPASATRVGSGS